MEAEESKENESSKGVLKPEVPVSNEEAAVEVLFSPPLYQQRYNLAIRYLTQHGVKSMVDLGCAECSFFKLLPTVPSLLRVLLVDVDRALVMSKDRVIEPELRHFIYRRRNPFEVGLYAGSAADFDSRLAGCEAVTMIEVIEHLFPDVLHQVTKNVFGNIRPKLCIVTTPNSEFNPLFGNTDAAAFRHWDHKFEWTRQEFQVWCENVCCHHGYQVEYDGVGFLSAKPDTFHLGPCSQAAIFTLIDQESQSERRCDSEAIGIGQTYYELIAESSYPYKQCERSQTEVIDEEISYCIRQIAHLKRQGVARTNNDDDGDDADTDRFIITVDHIASMRSVKSLCGVEEVRERLRLNGFDISADGEHITVSISDLLGEEKEEEEREDLYNNMAIDQEEIEIKGSENDKGNNSFTQIRWESDWDLT